MCCAESRFCLSFAFTVFSGYLPLGAPDVPQVRQLGQLVSFGWLGVNLFFVLSGFLITGVLLDTRTQKNYWSSFYIRRFLRIVPLYVAVLVILKFTLNCTWAYLILCLFYLANFAVPLRVPGPGYGPSGRLRLRNSFTSSGLIWSAGCGCVRWPVYALRVSYCRRLYVPSVLRIRSSWEVPTSLRGLSPTICFTARCLRSFYAPQRLRRSG